MSKVYAIAKQTLHGSYGLASVGDKIVLEERHAKQLERNNLIEIIGEAEDDAPTEKEGSFRITDNTGAEKEKAEAETDPNNPTGQKEKKEPSGPKGRKTK